MRLFILIVSTALCVLFLMYSVKGSKYDSYVEDLDSNDYPIKEIYGIGFALEEIPLFSLKGKMNDKLTSQAKLLYKPIYAEYYTKLTWAQSLSFAFLSLSAGFAIAGLLDSFFFAVIGFFVAVILGYYFYNGLSDKLNKRQIAASEELPEIVSSMALLMNAGLVLKETWEKIAYSNDGEIYNLMRIACEDMENGMSESDALHKFAMNSNSPDVKKFTSSLIQSLDKGNSDICNYLIGQSTEMWELRKQYMLQKGEAAASKLLAPIAIIFGGVLVIVISAAFSSLI